MNKRVRVLFLVAPGREYNKKRNKLSTRYGFKREWILERKKYKFEDEYFWGTKDYDECLTYVYGDYMKLPPEEERMGHAPLSEIDLKEEGLS